MPVNLSQSLVFTWLFLVTMLLAFSNCIETKNILFLLFAAQFLPGMRTQMMMQMNHLLLAMYNYSFRKYNYEHALFGVQHKFLRFTKLYNCSFTALQYFSDFAFFAERCIKR